MYLLSRCVNKERLHGILLTRDDRDKSFKLWSVYLKEASTIEEIIKDLRKSIILDKPPKRTGNEKRCKTVS